jgi:protoheme IX farnesyltransferase
MLKAYYSLTKPGLIRGNLITTAAGFLLASKGHIDISLLLATLIGLSLVIASGCVFNNYYDQDIDAQMDRTKNRALVSKVVSNKNAIIFAVILGILGFLVLFLYTNIAALVLAFIGFIFYVFLYTPLKHYSVHSTLVGSIAGATPIVVGYTAVTHSFDRGALLLFIILILWQMPHFYSIAIRRIDDYTAASIPVLPVQKGILRTKLYMVIYIAAFVAAAIMLKVYGYVGYIYLTLMLLCGLEWLLMGIKGFFARDNAVWARKMFIFSLLVLMAFSVAISIDAVLTWYIM